MLYYTDSYRFLCLLFVPMSECYHVAVLNENALCLLMEILHGVWLCMKAEFWWVHTKRCKRLLGLLFGLNMILVIICANLMQSTKLWLIGPSHVCYSCTWSSLLWTIVLHLGRLVDWIWSWNIKCCVVILCWTSLVVRQLCCVLQSPSATFFGSLIGNFCFSFRFVFSGLCAPLSMI